MINAIIQGIFKLIMGLVDVVLKPIDLLIESVLPDVSQGLYFIGQLFDIVGKGLSWAVNASGLHSGILSFLVLFMTFKLTVPVTVSAIKKAIKWYNALKI